jgi:glycosyltransferase involved in cell wall biosynthesis
MRVALVADTFSVEKGTGIARYSQEMLSGLRSKGLFVEPIAPEPPAVPLGLAINHALRMPCLVRSKAGDFDVIHATSPITALAFPVVQRPRVVTYLDLVSLLCDETSSAVHTRLFAPLFLRIGKFADRIIAISSQTKQELIRHLGLPAEKIAVVNLGIADAFQPQSRMNTGNHVIGYVGALNRRKALPYLMRAIRVLKASHPELPAKLVICGEKKLEYDTLVGLATDLGLNQIIEFRGSLTDEELVDAYNSFDVFVLPSEWEGFGLPVLEAQRCGVPVITRREARIPQEVSRCCLKASSEEDMADKIHELLTNRNLRQTIIEEGLEYSQQFTWERTVRETVEVYEQILS